MCCILFGTTRAVTTMRCVMSRFRFEVSGPAYENVYSCVVEVRRCPLPGHGTPVVRVSRGVVDVQFFDSGNEELREARGKALAEECDEVTSAGASAPQKYKTLALYTIDGTAWTATLPDFSIVVYDATKPFLVSLTYRTLF
mgnify:CR=1 FL=1